MDISNNLLDFHENVNPDLLNIQTNNQISKFQIKQEITHVYIKKEVEDDAFEKIPEVPLKVKIKTEENVVKFPPEEAFPVYMNG